MDLQLSDKTVLVTGSTAGIGLAIATIMAGQGAAVVVNGRSDQRVAAAIKTIQRENPDAKISGVAADLATAEGANKIIARIPRVDVLVNNVGIFEIGEFTKLTDEHWQRAFEVNVMSGVRLSRAYFPLMLKANWGRIIFISSESALQIPVEMIQYGMTKTAQLAVARGLAEMTAGTNVTVNSVLAGPTRSEGVEKFVADLARQQKTDESTIEKEFFKTARPTSLLKRFERPEEIAQVVAFVASPQSSAINGAALRADGGVVKSII